MDTPQDIRDALPAEPSRGTVRKHAFFVTGLCGAALVAMVVNGHAHWSALLIPVAGMIGSLLVHASGRSVDLNAWMKSAVRMVEAKYGR